MTTRRHLLRATAAALATGAAAPWTPARAGEAAPFPERALSLWVPWTAGGGTDLTLRLLAELAQAHLGQRIVIENRGGAGGTLAMPVLQQALPDGYTLAQMPQTVFRAPFTRKVAWDPIRDTTPILQVSGVTFGLLVPVDSPLDSVADLLAQAAAQPGRVTIATNGIGTTPHVVLDALFARHGLSFVHVPYKGVAEQMIELGHDIVAMSPYGLAGPRGLPEAVVRRLHDAFRSALFDARYIAELARYDQEVAYLDSAAYARSMREAYAAEKRTVERLGLAPA